MNQLIKNLNNLHIPSLSRHTTKSQLTNSLNHKNKLITNLNLNQFMNDHSLFKLNLILEM